MNILVTPGHWHAVAGAARSFGRAGHRVFVLSSQEHLPLHHSRHTTGFYLVDEHDENQWLNDLLNVLKGGTPLHSRNQEAVPVFDCFIPFSDPTLERTLRFKSDIERFTRLFLPPQDAARVCLDKARFYDFCRRHDLPVIPTESVQSPESFETVVRRRSLPFIIKEPAGQAGSGVTFVDDEPARRLQLASAARRSYPLMIQPYWGTTFAGSFALAHKGELLGYFAFITKEKWVRRGSPPVCWSCDDAGLFDLTRRVVAALEWTGIIDLDFLIADGGECVLLEANPRFSGTSLFAYRMGWDVFGDWLSLHLNGTIDGRHNGLWFKGGRLFANILPEWPRCLQQGLLGVREAAWFLLRSTGRTNLYWDDPLSIWWHIKNAVWERRTKQGV